MIGGDKKDTKSRMVAIGMDSADFYLVDQWMKKGKLPAMASLMKSGCWSNLVSTADVGSGTVWPTFFTGRSPAKHNGLGSRRMKSGTYQINFSTHETHINQPPFWVQLDRSGKRVAVLDVPRTRPIEGLNGLQLVGWGAHSPAWHTDSWPPELHREVVSRFGLYPAPDDDEFIPTSYRELKTFYEQLIAGIEKKESISRYFLQQKDWDFFLTVFAETHCVGHNYWHLMEKEHPMHDPKMALKLGDAILNVYSAAIIHKSRLNRNISRLPDHVLLISFILYPTRFIGFESD